MNNYDILCISETHLDCYDCADIQGYVFLSKPRTKHYKRKSGGIGIYVKQTLYSYVKVENSDSDYILWLCIDISVIGSTENILLGAIYLPPETSRFFSLEEFDIFDNCILDMCRLHSHVILAGDFNSRIAKLRDFVPHDNFFFDLFDFNADTEATLNPHLRSENLGVSLNRCSKDTTTNSHSLRLIDICRNNNLFVLNGRVGDDLGGNFTFRGKSVIDYVLATASCFKYILHFSIIETDPLFF